MVLFASATTATASAATAPQALWQAPSSGETGSAAGQVDGPSSIATDPVSGHLYVDDYANARIVELDAWGEFVKAWGWGVADGAEELQTCGPGANPPTATCQRGSKGSGVGQFSQLSGGIAVDAAGDIYVGDLADQDSGNHRVQKFDSDGNFLLMFGGGVDKGPLHPGNVCTAAFIEEGDVCGKGTLGSGSGEFQNTLNLDQSRIAVGSSNTVFVGDVGRIQEFEADGTFKGQVTLKGELEGRVVHSLEIEAGGNFYLTFYALNGSGSSIPTPIQKVSPTGDALSAVFTGNVGGIALDEVGDLFAIVETADRKRREVIEFGPSGEAIVPVGSGFSVQVDSEGRRVVPTDLATNTVTEAGGTDIYVATGSADGIGFISAYGPPPDKWAPPSFPPSITSQYAVSVGNDSAVVGAEINPRFWADTTYYVEYGAGKCSEGGCTEKKPLPPGLELGAGIVSNPVSSKGILLTGLLPQSTYHYRFVAQSSGGGPTVGVGPGEAEGTLRTRASSSPRNEACPNRDLRSGASARLADCRAYEMVSPVEKNNTDIVSLINLNSNPASLNQSAPAGDKLTYTTSQGFGDAQGVPYVSQYIASRGADGWQNHGITPPQGISGTSIGARVDIEFRAFTPDLCGSVLRNFTDPVLAPGALEGSSNLYLRQNCGEEGYQALISAEAGKAASGEVQGISDDGRCAVFYTLDKLTANANATGVQTYEGCGAQLALISVLPNGNAYVGPSSVGTANSSVGIRSATDETALSSDGSRVYWTNTEYGPGTLYLRENPLAEQSALKTGKCTEPQKACTIKVSGTVSNGEAHFWNASPDGSRALFTMEDTHELYEFDAQSKESTLIGTGVIGVLGAGEDASRVYFLSKEALGVPNSRGDAAIAGEPNLYLHEAGGESRFIATLSAADAAPGAGANTAITPINVEPFKKGSRVSADGLHVAFMSSASPTGYDNVDALTGERVAEVYVYDATADGGEGRLGCASCNPTGQRPTGRNVKVEGTLIGTTRAAALLPTYLTELYGSRAISADGSRVFFNSYEALVLGDTNGKADVYEWEATGAGDCSEQSGAYSAPNGGCLSLISSGESPSDSAFVDASADAKDVFFTTASSLLPQDPGLIDIYDARAGGGYPPAVAQPAACEGEACQGPLAPPNDPTPASAAFEGAGNVVKGRAKKKKAHKAKAHKKKQVKKQKRRGERGSHSPRADEPKTR
jgi:hypothetical protein